MRQTLKIAILSIAFLAAGLSPLQADTIMTKSGQLYKGTVVSKTSDSYTMKLDDGGETVQIPVSTLYMGDFDPTSTVVNSKGSVAVLDSVVENQTKPRPAEEPSRQRRPDSSGSGVSHSGEIAPPKGITGVLKYAQDTVALSNARTEQSQKNIEEMKAVADAANAG